MFNKLTALVFSACLTANVLSAQPVQSDYDWDNYTSWEDKTHYTKTYVVNQRHHFASDSNPGTDEKPFLTLGKAAGIVQAGERILVYSGIYREMPVLKNQGLSADRMIAIEAAPGEKVIVRGSRILNTEWMKEVVSTTDELLKFTGLNTRSKKIWFMSLPDSLFENDYYPLRLANIEPYHYELMPWAESMKEIPPCNLARGLLFQNGKRMVQLAHPGDLSRLPGSFWVSPDGKTICFHPYGSRNPKGDLFELGVQSHLFKPEKLGSGYVRLSGLTFEHCANGFLRTSTGAVTIAGGHHWIIENNTIRQNNSSGLEFGYHAFEPRDRNPLNIRTGTRRGEESAGVVVRNNLIYECGTAGIRSYGVINGVIENNEIYNCGWQDVETYWEVAGIKLLTTRNTLVRGNHIYNIQGGNGIWLDWDNRYSRISANLIHDIQALQAGIFIEASQNPNLVDNNIVWNIDGHGLFGDDTDEAIYAHNLIAHTTGPLVHAIVATDRQLNRRPLTSERNRIVNNIFIDGGKEIRLTSENNVVDYNLYVFTREPQPFSSESGKASGFDLNSQEIRAWAEIKPYLHFAWKSRTAVKGVPVLPFLRSAFVKGRRDGEMTVPGPFPELPEEFQMSLTNSR
ncbi:MAG: right-handed parallel beta-helix repeat-containing protein [Tannerellaceae bacterium]|jgi:hypothetical protein|nr:right-handed parallel beta-helix repeat-containing protein [Tannerellaceae bacterium]